MSSSRVRFPAVLVATALSFLVDRAPAALAGESPDRGAEETRYERRERESAGLEAFAGGGAAEYSIVLPILAATGEAGTLAEIVSLSQRDAASADLEDFTGGSEIVLIIAIVLLAVVLVVWILTPW